MNVINGYTSNYGKSQYAPVVTHAVVNPVPAAQPGTVARHQASVCGRKVVVAFSSGWGPGNPFDASRSWACKQCLRKLEATPEGAAAVAIGDALRDLGDILQAKQWDDDLAKALDAQAVAEDVIFDQDAFRATVRPDGNGFTVTIECNVPDSSYVTKWWAASRSQAQEVAVTRHAEAMDLMLAASLAGGAATDPEKCDCGKGDHCPLWRTGTPTPAARAARDARVAQELKTRPLPPIPPVSLREALEAAQAALKVVETVPMIREFLKTNDPMAWRQVQRASATVGEVLA